MFDNPPVRSLLWMIVILIGILLCIIPAVLISASSYTLPDLPSQADSSRMGVLQGLLPESNNSREVGKVILIPVSIYILDDLEGNLSSAREAEELAGAIERVNQIWSQANIAFQIQGIYRIGLTGATLEDMAGGEFRSFFQEIQSAGAIPSPAVINAFYAQEIGGPNGINPAGTRLFFVADNPTVHDERVTAHEIGHILGLHHTFESPDRLIYPGTNGVQLTPEEITVARYVASGILNGLR